MDIASFGLVPSVGFGLESAVKMMIRCSVILAVVCLGAALAGDTITQSNVKRASSGRSAVGFGTGQNKLINRHQHSGHVNKQSKSGHQNAINKNRFGQNQGLAKSKSGFAHQDHDQSSALYDNYANQAAQEAVKYGNSVIKDGQYKQNNMNNKAGFKKASAKKNSFNRGNILNDNISYGFDKKFNRHVGEKGGFEEELGASSHKLDEYRDRQRALNLRRGNHASNLSKANAKKALRESNFNKNAAQKAVQNSKYANKDKRLDKAQKRADLQDIAYDKKDKRYRASQKGKDESVRKFDDFAVKDAQFNRNDASSAKGKKGEATEKFYKDAKHGRNGIASAPRAGHTSHNLHGAPRRGSANVAQTGGNAAKNSALYGETAKHLQNANNHNARKAGKHAAALNNHYRAKDLYDTNQIKSLRDSRRGNLKNAIHNSENGGFNDNNALAAKSASAKNRQYADAAAKNTANQARKDLDEAKFDKENSKRVLADRNQSQRKLKRFFHDKQEGGNNFERLNFNRKRIQSDFGNQQAAAAQSAKKFNNNHNENVYTADRRKDEHVAARQSKGVKQKRNKAASQNGHLKKSNSQVAKQASSAGGFKDNVGQKSFNNNNLLSAKGKQGIQEQHGAGGIKNGIRQNVGGTHGNGGFGNFGNFHSFGNNGFGVNPIKSSNIGHRPSYNDLGFGSNSIGFGANTHGNFAGARFAPLNKQCYKEVDLAAGYQLSSSASGYPSQQINEEINNRPSMAKIFSAPSPTDYQGNDYQFGRQFDFSGPRYKRMASFGSFGRSGFSSFGFGAPSNQCPADQRMLKQFTKFGGSCFIVAPEKQKIMFNKCSTRDCPSCPTAKGANTKCMETYGWVNVYAYCENIDSSEKIRPLRLYLPTGCGAQSYTC